VDICLEQGADCISSSLPKPLSSLASFISRLVLPFWYRLTQIVLVKRPLNGCSSSCCCCCDLMLRTVRKFECCGCPMFCTSEPHKALSCFHDASAGLLVDNFLLTMMAHVSHDCDSRHLEVLYYLQVVSVVATCIYKVVDLSWFTSLVWPRAGSGA